MKKYSQMIPGVVLAVLVMLVFPSLLLAAPDPVFDEVRELVENFYVDPVDADYLNATSSRELITELGDPYSQYMTAAEFDQFMESIEGQFAGVGVYLPQQIGLEGIEIIGVVEGSPAQRAGLKAGDVVINIDHKSVRGLNTDTVCQMLLGNAGTKVELEVKAGEVNKTITLIRQIISIPVVQSVRLDFNIGYINIDSFSDQADQDLVETIENCRKDGVDKWIIDLRGNPGGYIDTALEIAGIFIGSEVVTVLEERESVIRYYPDPPPTLVKDPVILLIDENSASASEILAAALKDYRKAILLGQTTYGKGTVQEIYSLSNGDWVKLTTARFYSPLGSTINGVGVTPDLALDSIDMIKVAELLLSDPGDGGAGNFELLVNGHGFLIDLALARSPQYWKAWGEINDHLDYLPAYKEFGGEYALLTSDQVQDKVDLYYPYAKKVGKIDNYSPDQDVVLYISREAQAGWNQDHINMCNAKTGEEVEVDVEEIVTGFTKIKPVADLLPGEYWIILNDGQQFNSLARIGVQQ